MVSEVAPQLSEKGTRGGGDFGGESNTVNIGAKADGRNNPSEPSGKTVVGGENMTTDATSDASS